MGEGVADAATHDLLDPEQEGSSDGARRMIAGKLLGLKAAGLENGHGQSIPHHEHGGGAGSGSETERAGLTRDFHIQDDVAETSQARFRRRRSWRQSGGKLFKSREQVEQLLRFSGVAEREDNIAVVHHAQIAMDGIDGVEPHAGAAGAGESGGDFAADVSGFANSNHHDFTPLAQSLDDEFDCLIEPGIELRTDRFERCQFDIKNFPRTGEMVIRENCQLYRWLAMVNSCPKSI